MRNTHHLRNTKKMNRERMVYKMDREVTGEERKKLGKQISIGVHSKSDNGLQEKFVVNFLQFIII